LLNPIQDRHGAIAARAGFGTQASHTVAAIQKSVILNLKPPSLRIRDKLKPNF
jgi:hypothetical protein